MKTLYKILLVTLVPIGVSILAGLIAKLLGGDSKYYAGFYLGLTYVMCMYEVGFIKRGLNV